MHVDSDDIFVNIIVLAIGGVLLYVVGYLIAIPKIKKNKKIALLLTEAEQLFHAENYKASLGLVNEAERISDRPTPSVYFRKAMIYDKLCDLQNARSCYDLFLRNSEIGIESPEIDTAKKRIVEIGNLV